MKTFDIKRFCHVAKWDLTINRSFYLRLLLILACCVLVPVVLQCIDILYDNDFCLEEIRNNANRNIIYLQSLTAINASLIFIGYLWQFLMLGYAFHNLRTKQGRINELTLPATNLERFSWHVLFCIVAPFVAFWACELVADGIHMLYSRFLFDITNTKSLTLLLWEKNGLQEVMRVFFGTSAKAICGFIMASLLLLSFYSSFILGNAWKYRSNIGLTIAFHIALALSFMVFVGFISSLGWISIDETETNRWIVLGIGLTLSFCLLVFIWWLTYRLYCKAQITTRRNP